MCSSLDLVLLSDVPYSTNLSQERYSLQKVAAHGNQKLVYLHFRSAYVFCWLRGNEEKKSEV